MNCPNCGKDNLETARFCEVCGTKMEVPVTPETPAPVVQPETAPVVQTEAAPVEKTAPAEPEIPEKYRPISSWGYVGYWILYSIPLLGFIFWVIHVFSSKNLNRRNYARSFFCAFLLGLLFTVILALVAFVCTALLGVSFAALFAALVEAISTAG